MTTATTERRKEAICPPWCVGHDGRYQSWETRTDDGGQVRDHGNRGIQVGDAHVGLIQRESEDHTMGPAIVDIYVDHDTAELCTEDAKAFAEAILQVVQEARDWNAFQLGRDLERGLASEERAALSARIDQCNAALQGITEGQSC